MKNLERTLQLLPLAYLFLIVLGILKESLFYLQVGINIMNYSSIVDVIMSPISELTSSGKILISSIVLSYLPFFFMSILKKNSHKKWTYNFTGEKNMEQYSEDEKAEKYTLLTFAYLASIYVGYFIGYGFMNGQKISEKIEKNKIHFEDTINLNSNAIKKCHILGSNSQYFFVLNTNKEVEIIPLGAVSTIVNLPEKK